jgi:hypothetical protein
MTTGQKEDGMSVSIGLANVKDFHAILELLTKSKLSQDRFGVRSLKEFTIPSRFKDRFFHYSSTPQVEVQSFHGSLWGQTKATSSSRFTAGIFDGRGFLFSGR